MASNVEHLFVCLTAICMSVVAVVVYVVHFCFVHLMSNLKFIAETNVKELSPLFSSRSFMFSGLTFKS